MFLLAALLLVLRLKLDLLVLTLTILMIGLNSTEALLPRPSLVVEAGTFIILYWVIRV